ncbi:MAG: hypothetical protein ACFFC7_34905, partial [Candidatus Hermodarchaeota archaeon]
MRAKCGLFALLLILNSIGIGIIHSVNSPNIGDSALEDIREEQSENHGTRSTPSEVPTFIDLFFHNGFIMNTSNSSSVLPFTDSGSFNFILQDPLINDFLIEEQIAIFPMTAIVYLSGSGSVDITVRDGSGGPIVGTTSYGPFALGGTPQLIMIYIPFNSGNNYNFPAGNQIAIEFDFGGTLGYLFYDSISTPSRLKLYGTTVPDISLTTSNFYDILKDRFYPNDINFPDERKKVKINGLVTEVFGKKGEFQYINQVQVQIIGPGYNDNYSASYNKSTYEYNYTWNYPNGQTPGKYAIVTHVIDEQNNEFTITGTFNMSQYGVLLTSPSQVPEEGYFMADAKRNVIQYTTTAYKINVRNIGSADTVVNLSTTGKTGWDWWLEGENLTKNNGSKNDTVMMIAPGGKREIRLFVDSTDRPIGDSATIIVTAVCTEEPGETSILQTKTTVVLFQLNEDWNLISVPFILSNTNIDSVLSSIGMSYDAAQWYNISDTSDSWKHKHTSKPSHLNDFTDIDHTIGFWIHITQPGGALLDYSGTPPTSNQSIPLHPGWN